MYKFFFKNFSLISFIFVPIIFLWHPNWLAISGVQPYWPLFWLLPWSMTNGAINGCIFGLFLGIILDSITIGGGYTQMPGLMLCGLFFGKITLKNDNFVEHFRYGLICVLGTFVCLGINILQIMVINFSEEKFLFLSFTFKNVLVQIFLTGIFAPLICSKLLKLFKSSKPKNFLKY